MPINDDLFQEEDDPTAEKEKDGMKSFESELPLDEDDDIIELSNVSDAPNDDEILELEEALETLSDEESVLELTDTDIPAPEEEDDVIDLSVEARHDHADDEDVLDLTDETLETSADEDDVVALTAQTMVETEPEEDITELTEPAADTPQKRDGIPTASMGEDKEILELIDDIQATLSDSKTQKPADGTVPMASADKSDDDNPIILGDEETFETEALSYSESEFVDHLGLDLTSEFSREIFGEQADKASVLIDPAQLEEAIEKVFHKMLTQENSPLIRAIILAVRKEIENKIV